MFPAIEPFPACPMFCAIEPESFSLCPVSADFLSSMDQTTMNYLQRSDQVLTEPPLLPPPPPPRFPSRTTTITTPLEIKDLVADPIQTCGVHELDIYIQKLQRNERHYASTSLIKEVKHYLYVFAKYLQKHRMRTGCGRTHQNIKNVLRLTMSAMRMLESRFGRNSLTSIRRIPTRYLREMCEYENHRYFSSVCMFLQAVE